MKYEIEQAESMEALGRQEHQQNLEMNPPKLESAEKAQDVPPKLERSQTLGGSVTQMMIEMNELRLQQAKQELAEKIAEHNAMGEGTLGESRDAFNKRKALEASTNRIEAQNRARDYAKQLAEDARKEQEYREKLYGK